MIVFKNNLLPGEQIGSLGHYINVCHRNKMACTYLTTFNIVIHTLQIIHNKLLFCCFLENKFENIHEKSTIKAKKHMDTLIPYKANQKDTQAEPVENVWLGWSTFYEVNLLQKICNTTETFIQLTFSSIPPMNYIMFKWLIQYCASILHWKHLKNFFL